MKGIKNNFANFYFCVFLYGRETRELKTTQKLPILQYLRKRRKSIESEEKILILFNVNDLKITKIIVTKQII